MQHALGRVIGHRNQAWPGFGIPCEPRVHAAVEVQHLAETRPGLTIGRAFGIGWLWLGIALLTIDLAALLAMLSVENVSFVIPTTALSYVVGALGGAFFLGERVGPARWMGVLIVCAGVALVFAGRR